MKAILYLPAIVACLASAAIVRGEKPAQNWYLNADAGAVFQQVASFRESTEVTQSATFNPGVRGDLALGYRFCKSWAGEFETGLMWNSVNSVGGTTLSSRGESIDLYQVPILANLIYQVPTKCSWVPYLGVGGGGDIGIFHGGRGNSDTDIEPAVQGEAGLKYLLSRSASIGIAYKFLGTLDQRYYASSINDHLTFSGVYIHGVFVNFTLTF